MDFHHEKMSNEFEKWHINGLPFSSAIHHFTGIDKGGPHDHPFRFVSHVLKGSYVEKVYSWTSDGRFSWQNILRQEGTSHIVEAETIHEIVDLPDGECWTAIVPEPKVREPRFWKFDDSGIHSRCWNESIFTLEKKKLWF